MVKSAVEELKSDWWSAKEGDLSNWGIREGLSVKELMPV